MNSTSAQSELITDFGNGNEIRIKDMAMMNLRSKTP
jgi:hypothetical protein